MTDVTEFRVADKKLYLSPVIDLFNREVVSFSLSERPLFGMVRSMLESAFERLENGSGLILHFDQGWQYRMPDYRDILRKHSVHD
ncbi:transposase family protein [Kineobactrum salinum]|uniref:Transposase family protein n=1 Tax=Kineobactrum salinum TaxID=2708301 RepID=A0A6C0U4D1_9GAMM|nr:transposase family protein [Kineobactrum salinum]